MWKHNLAPLRPYRRDNILPPGNQDILMEVEPDYIPAIGRNLSTNNNINTMSTCNPFSLQTPANRPVIRYRDAGQPNSGDITESWEYFE
jgi:hypothetical protein